MGAKLRMTNQPLEEPRGGLLKRLSEPEALQLIPEAVARKYAAIPLVITDNALRVAMAHPEDIFALEALATQSQMRIETESKAIQGKR